MHADTQGVTSLSKTTALAAVSTTPNLSTATPTIATVAVAGPTPFEALTAAHLEQYRPPTGALTHPDTMAVANPYDADTPDRAAARAIAVRGQRRANISLGATLTTGVGAMGAIAVLGTVNPAIFGFSATLFIFFVCLTGVSFECHYDRKVEATKAPPVSVPADVGAAYTAFQHAPSRLRSAGADENTVGVVEARMGHMDDLLVEAARLHALGADASEDGLAVRERMITHAAKAQSLLVLAQRQSAAIADADAGTALVLGRGVDDDGFDQAGVRLVEDTEFVRGVLNPRLPMMDGTRVHEEHTR